MLLILYKIAQFLCMFKVPILPKMIKGIIYFFFHCVIPPECRIGKGTTFWHHGLGVIIHPDVEIGNNCQIYNHVVFGGGHDGPAGPPFKIIVGENVVVAAGAKILCSGETLTIGANSSIAANAVVLDDVPPGVVVGGVPARIVKWKNNPITTH